MTHKNKKTSTLKSLVCLCLIFILWQNKAIAQSDTLVYSIQEVILVSSNNKQKNTPLRLKSIDNNQIERLATTKTYPELMKSIPGVYATSESGSYGDAKINIRGFKQDNISVLLNGIPISGLTSGSMFWNNWLGLTDATQSIQVQKGVGGSMLSDNSVGGTINIITKITDPKPSYSFQMFTHFHGTTKANLNYNSGITKNGWGISAMVSYVWGKGYVEQTNVNSMAYMLNISKKINNKHSILFTALGSPETHEQRSSRLKWSEVEEYGLSYNKNWGLKNGKPYNISKNNYFKPYFTLNHYYNSSTKFSLNNTIYAAIGNGGGRWTESKGQRIINYQKDGQIDWNTIIAENKAQEDGSAQNILSDYIAGHTQLGAKSIANLKLNEKWNLEMGLHYQFYSTWEHEKITDLLEGEYWFEDYEKNSLMGTAGRNPYKEVGDFIRTNNGRIIHHGTAYVLGNYRTEKFNINIGTSFFGSTMRRWDQYNYAQGNTFSQAANGVGYSIKGGVLYNLTNAHKFYGNIGIYSRLPYYNVYFSSGNNQLTENVKNERNYLGELGYRFVYDKGGMEFTGYVAYWQNKSLVSEPYKQMDQDSYKYMVQGLDALHYGVEFDAYHRFNHWLKLYAFASVGDWRWKNNVKAKIYDPYTGQLADEINIYTDNLHVGDAPQTQVGAGIEFIIAKELSINLDWQYNARYYADFDPASRIDPDDKSDSYKSAPYNVLNSSLNWSRKWSDKFSSTIFANFNNLTNSIYIERGRDGKDHSLDSFTGFWSIGFNGSIGFRVNF